MKKSTRPVRLGPAAQHMRTKQLDITVLAGGPSDEREVSLMSGKCIAAALTTLGHRVTVSDISPADLSALDRTADVVFIALHGAFGEDGAVQRELERRKVPFVGSGSVASALAMDKVQTKARLVANGLPTPRFDLIRAGRVSEAVERWRLPVVVKPIASGSSVDTHLVRSADRFSLALGEVIRKHGAALLEELVDGPELTVGIVGNRVLPAIEIRTKRPFYDYQAKYIDDDTEYRFDIDLPPRLLADIGEKSLHAFQVLGCRGFGRVDWMVDRVTHEPFILEINTIPGFTTHSLLPKAAGQAGLNFAELCQRIIELAVLGDEAEGT
jgi:D-alanine-D-alanine ligase